MRLSPSGYRFLKPCHVLFSPGVSFTVSDLPQALDIAGDGLEACKAVVIIIIGMSVAIIRERPT